MESLYLIHAHSSRSAVLEGKINDLIGVSLLDWDSSVAPLIFSTGFQVSAPFLGPNILLGIWSPLVFLSIIGLFSYVCLTFAPTYFPAWIAVVSFLALYHIFDWSLLATKQRSRIDSAMRGGLSTYDEPSRVADQGFLVFLASLCFGFLPLLVLSLQTHTFLLSSTVSVPLTLIPSVFIGDSILLPLFNSKVWMLLAPALNKLTKSDVVKLIGAAIFSLAISASMMICEHMLWIRDQYTGFLKFSVGHLSPAGLWHLVFSSIEMAIIVWFFIVSLTWSCNSRHFPRKPLLNTWRIFWLYSVLSIADYFFRRVRLSMSGFRLSDAIALSPVVLASGAYLLLWYLTSRRGASRA